MREFAQIANFAAVTTLGIWTAAFLKEKKVRLVTKWTLSATREEWVWGWGGLADLMVANTSVPSKGRGQD